MKKCSKVFCQTCPYVVPSNSVKCSLTNQEVLINSSVTCKTSNVIYCITCKKCSQKYVGETSKELGQRFAQHPGYVNTYQGKIVEKVFDKSKAVRLIREKLYINLFESEHRGINRKSQLTTKHKAVANYHWVVYAHLPPVISAVQTHFLFVASWLHCSPIVFQNNVQ